LLLFKTDAETVIAEELSELTDEFDTPMARSDTIWLTGVSVFPPGSSEEVEVELSLEQPKQIKMLLIIIKDNKKFLLIITNTP
jgi:hypothetical protein